MSEEIKKEKNTKKECKSRIDVLSAIIIIISIVIGFSLGKIGNCHKNKDAYFKSNYSCPSKEGKAKGSHCQSKVKKPKCGACKKH